MALGVNTLRVDGERKPVGSRMIEKGKEDTYGVGHDREALNPTAQHLARAALISEEPAFGRRSIIEDLTRLADQSIVQGCEPYLISGCIVSILSGPSIQSCR